MKALIMAAGRGSRISENVGGVPKCTLPAADGMPMIRRSVTMMLKLGIEPVVCVGYRGDEVKEALKGLPVKYYENPFYAVTNNIASVWFTIPEMDGTQDILLLSGDLYYPITFLEKALEAKGNLTFFADSSRIEDGDFYLHVDENGYIDEYGKDTEPSLRQYEYMGFAKVNRAFVKNFVEAVKDFVHNGRYDTYFEEVILHFNKERTEKIDIIDVAGEFWREFDFYEDYKLILEHERESRNERAEV